MIKLMTIQINMIFSGSILLQFHETLSMSILFNQMGIVNSQIFLFVLFITFRETAPQQFDTGKLDSYDSLIWKLLE